ncbi:MAG: hypothetical protein ACOC2U_03345, partial [bacterium]
KTCINGGEFKMVIPKKIKSVILNKICNVCGSSFQTTSKAKIYCDDPRCQELRAELRKKALIEKKKETHNLIIPKGKFKDRTVLKIQCHANGHNGRCCETFNVLYQIDRTVYPKYCHLHTNKWKRKIFEGKVNAKSEHS